LLVKVLACDGGGSGTRASAEKEVAGFKSQVTPWNAAFRLLFSKCVGALWVGGVGVDGW
jgi:hypothetical protein